MTSAATTLREKAIDAALNMANVAAIKMHETMYESLYVESNGNLLWDAQPDSNSWLQREDDSLARILRVGTGSIECNCDGCIAGDDPSEWVTDESGSLAKDMERSISDLPVGFFDDEDSVDIE